MKTPHPQAEKIRAIADGAQMQEANLDWFINCTADRALGLIAEGHSAHIRIKPTPTIRIGDVEVPEPLRVAPLGGTTCHVVDLAAGSVETFSWIGLREQLVWLTLGLLQATEQGSKDMLAALIKQLGENHE